MDEQIKKAVDILRQGGIVIYPTDTAFGIGCRIDNAEAVEKLFRIRQRPNNRPTPVLFGSIEMVKEYVASIPQDVEPLLEKYWPGALTVILPAQINKVSDLVVGQTGIGCRIPNHPTPLRIIREIGVPIIGTSANFPGRPTPYTLADLDQELVKLVDLVVKGETSEHKESTVIDCTQKPWKLIRQGPIAINN